MISNFSTTIVIAKVIIFFRFRFRAEFDKMFNSIAEIFLFIFSAIGAEVVAEASLKGCDLIIDSK